jgi:D-serine deaminase-like pyridoxal phosphate-dependent protein
MGDALYARYRRAIADLPLPLAIVDLAAVDANVDALVEQARGTPIRPATKSLRCPELVEHVTRRGGAAIRGLLTYTARESELWFARGERDVILGYPTVQPSDAEVIARLNQSGSCAPVVDDPAQLDVLSARAREGGVTIPVVLEIDLAYRPLGAGHLGVRRSPVRSTRDAVALARRVRRTPGIRLHGVMGYEAQIAGLPDRGGSLAAPLVRAMKARSIPDVSARRASVACALREAGFSITVFNGGGTGSLGTAAREPHLTEVTAGSGFVCPHLFDGYDALRVSPALYFALQIVRRPARRIVTCLGGGYVASGEAGKSRLPIPALPHGLALLDREGAGEVQTPLTGRSDLALGDPVFFRPAKAGELAEHFTEYLFVRGDRVVGRAPTYRGMGECFLG